MFGTEVGHPVCSATRWRDLGSVGPASVGPASSGSASSGPTASRSASGPRITCLRPRRWDTLHAVLWLVSVHESVVSDAPLL